MIFFGNYTYSGFGGSKISALHNYFVNFIQYTYIPAVSTQGKPLLIGYQLIQSGIRNKIIELNNKFGGAPLFVEFDDPTSTHSGRVRITRGNSRQMIAEQLIYECSATTVI